MPSTDASEPVHVAFDVGSLHGRRTGVGNAVSWTLDALRDRDDVQVTPYVVSSRAKVRPPERRFPLPAAVAHRVWQWSTPLDGLVNRVTDRLIGHADVVHGTNYVVPPSTLPRVVSVYDCWFLEHPDDAGPDVARAGRVLRRSVQSGAHLLVSSEATAVAARALLETDRITCIHLGPPPPPPVQPSAGRPDRDTAPSTLDQHDLSAPFVLAIGTAERRKNLPTLIGAFGRLASEHETVRLVLAGAPGDDSPAIERALSLLRPDARSRVITLGPVTEQTKYWLLRNARTLAYPSLDEGFGFPLLEAHQVGTPVVASSAGSIPEVAGTAALFSPPTDTEALAANLHWIVTNDNMHERMVARGTRNLQRFSWANTADQLAAFYRELRATA